MNILFLLGVALSLNAFAQLEKPSATGVCHGPHDVDVTVINGQVHVKVQKKPFIKSCVLKIENAAVSNRRTLENITFYVSPEGCGGRARGQQGFDSGPLLDRGFVEIGKGGDGMVHLIKEGRPIGCSFDVKSWKKLESLAKKNRP